MAARAGETTGPETRGSAPETRGCGPGSGGTTLGAAGPPARGPAPFRLRRGVRGRTGRAEVAGAGPFCPVVPWVLRSSGCYLERRVSSVPRSRCSLFYTSTPLRSVGVYSGPLLGMALISGARISGAGRSQRCAKRSGIRSCPVLLEGFGRRAAGAWGFLNFVRTAVRGAQEPAGLTQCCERDLLLVNQMHLENISTAFYLE